MTEPEYIVEVRYGYCQLHSFFLPDEGGSLQGAYLAKEYDKNGRLVREDKGLTGIKLTFK